MCVCDGWFWSGVMCVVMEVEVGIVLVLERTISLLWWCGGVWSGYGWYSGVWSGYGGYCGCRWVGLGVEWRDGE